MLIRFTHSRTLSDKKISAHHMISYADKRFVRKDIVQVVAKLWFVGKVKTDTLGAVAAIQNVKYGERN